MEDSSDWCRAVINQRLSQNKDSLLKWIFNSEQVSANKIQIHLSNGAFNLIKGTKGGILVSPGKAEAFKEAYHIEDIGADK